MNELKVSNINPQYDLPHTIPDWITGIWKCWFRGEGKPEYPEKAFWSKGRNQKLTQPHETRARWEFFYMYLYNTTLTLLLRLFCQLEGVIDNYFYFSFWLV